MCAEIVKCVFPNALPDNTGDDDYLRKLLAYGDTTNPMIQQQVLRNVYGVKTATFRTDADWPLIDKRLDAGKGTGIGILHHGPVNGSLYGGHWIFVRGRKTINGKLFYIVDDPYGDLDLVNGGYPGSTNGKGLLYSKENLDKRWRVLENGKKTPGWVMTY